MVSTVVTPNVTLAGVALLNREVERGGEGLDDQPVEPEVEPGHEHYEDCRGVDLKQIVADWTL